MAWGPAGSFEQFREAQMLPTHWWYYAIRSIDDSEACISCISLL